MVEDRSDRRRMSEQICDSVDGWMERNWQEARLIILDDVGATVGAFSEPIVREFAARVTQGEGSGGAVAMTPGFPRYDVRTAALINGVAGCWLELDEGYRGAGCHAGVYTLPLLAAVASQSDMPLENLVRGLITGYEVGTRYARAWALPTTTHVHAALSGVSAAAAVAGAHGASPDLLDAAVGNALGVAIAGAYGHATEGSYVRNLWCGLGAVAGLTAWQAAQAGIRPLDDVEGQVLGAIIGASRRGRLAVSDVADPAIAFGYHKAYSACQHLHASIECALELSSAVDYSAISSIHVFVHSRACDLAEAVSPKTALGARFSLPHAVSAAFVYGGGGPESFSEAALHDLRVAALRKKVTAEIDPTFAEGQRSARMVVELLGGEQREMAVSSARGNPDRPLTAEDLVAKADALGSGVGLQGLGAQTYRLTDQSNRTRSVAQLFAELDDAVRPQ